MTILTKMTKWPTHEKKLKKVAKTFENRNGNVVSLQHQKTTHQASKRDAPRCKRQRTKVRVGKAQNAKYKIQNIKYKIQNIKYNPATFGQKSADWSDDDGNDEP